MDEPGEPRRLYVVMSHTLDAEQAREARSGLQVGEIIPLPVPLQALWGAIPPESASLREAVKPLTEWLGAARTGDYVLVQGEFGATWLIVDWCLRHDLIPLHATTGRAAVEIQLPDGSTETKRIFRHVRFRRYGE